MLKPKTLHLCRLQNTVAVRNCIAERVQELKEFVQNYEKLIPLSPCSKNVCTGSIPLPPCPCEHTINFENFEVLFAKKCGRPHLKKSPTSLSEKCRTEKNPLLLTADVFYGRPHTQLNCIIISHLNYVMKPSRNKNKICSLKNTSL